MTKNNSRFFINIIPSISTVSVVGSFIPIKDISIWVIVAFLILELTVTLFDSIYKKIIKGDNMEASPQLGFTVLFIITAIPGLLALTSYFGDKNQDKSKKPDFHKC